MGHRGVFRAPRLLAAATVLLAMVFVGFTWRGIVSPEERLRTHNVRPSANRRGATVAVHRHEPPVDPLSVAERGMSPESSRAPEPSVVLPLAPDGGDLDSRERPSTPRRESWLDWVSTNPWSDQTQLRYSGTLGDDDSTNWELQWSGNVSGDATSALNNPIAETGAGVDQIFFTRRERDRALLRAGRLRPGAFASVGTLDGIEGELNLTRAFRTGVTAGFRPEDSSGDVSSDKTVVLPYVAGEVGSQESVRYASKLGLMSSFYRGDPDRLAVLLDQKASVTDRVRLRSRTTFDLATPSGAAQHPTLTDLDVAGEISVLSSLVLRAGFVHERTLKSRESEESEAAGDDDALWRRWVAATHELPWDVRVSGEIALVDEPERGQEEMWSISVVRDGLVVLPQGNIVARVESAPYGIDGYNARVSLNLPFAEGKLTVAPGFWLQVDKDSTRRALRWRAREASISLQWLTELPFRLTATGSYKFHDDTKNNRFAEIGAEWRW